MSKFLKLLFISVVLCACTVRLIGVYDQVIDQKTSELQQKVDAYLISVERLGISRYDAAFYDDVVATINVLKTRAHAQDGKDITVKQLELIADSIEKMREIDTSNGL